MSTKAKANQLDAAQVRFYLAEDFRPEANNKVSAIGLYPDNRILLQIPPSEPDPTPEKPAAIRSLSFLFNISDAPEAATVSIDVAGPGANKVLVPSQILPPNSEGGTANFIIRFDPFVIPVLGKHSFSVKVNQHEFEFSYAISRQQVAQQVATDSQPPLKGASRTRSKRFAAKSVQP
jgi:hypothetical protein